MSSKVKVAVRARPLNKRELECGADIIVTMSRANTSIKTPDKKPPKTFTFDHCFYSVNPKDADFASQDQVGFFCVSAFMGVILFPFFFVLYYLIFLKGEESFGPI